MLALVNAAEVERERQDEEHESAKLSRCCKNIAGFGAKGRFRGTAAEGCAHAAVFGLLRQDDEHDKQRYEDENEGKNSEDDAHVKE